MYEIGPFSFRTGFTLTNKLQLLNYSLRLEFLTLEFDSEIDSIATTYLLGISICQITIWNRGNTDYKNLYQRPGKYVLRIFSHGCKST